MHKLEYCLLQIAMSLKEENPELMEDLRRLSSKSHNYTEPSREIEDISEKFIKKIRLMDPNFKD
jgi:hypothetical protein